MQSHDSISEGTEENVECEIDASSRKILDSMASQSHNDRMSREDYALLTTEVKETWSKIPHSM